MAQTGKKINELTALTTVSDETVLPAVYVSGGNPSSTANKVSIEQISNKITNDLSTILNSKQDKLTAGDNITIESNVISATDTQYTAGTNITISEQNVISADVDALPSQTGQSGKFLTTDGTDASWAEVNVPNNVWTQDNLKAGENVTITQIQKPVIDENTISLYHFNNNIKDEISGEDATYSADLGIFYAAGKFDNCLYMRRNSNYMVVSPSYNLDNNNSTIDFWFRNNPENTATSLRLTAFSQSTETAHNPYLIMAFSNYIYLGKYISGTGSAVEASFSGELDFTVWNHIAYVVDATNNKVYLFLNGTKIYDQSITSSLVSTANTWTIIGRYAEYDEVRVSNVARWNSDFTPYTLPYAPASGQTEYQINAIIPQGGSAPTLTWYTGNTGTTVTIADTTSASLVKVYKNGILLEPTEDYSISGTTLTLVSALESQDKITTEVFA